MITAEVKEDYCGSKKHEPMEILNSWAQSDVDSYPPGNEASWWLDYWSVVQCILVTLDCDIVCFIFMHRILASNLAGSEKKVQWEFHPGWFNPCTEYGVCFTCLRIKCQAVQIHVDSNLSLLSFSLTHEGRLSSRSIDNCEAKDTSHSQVKVKKGVLEQLLEQVPPKGYLH